jgi:hypothetical protein
VRSQVQASHPTDAPTDAPTHAPQDEQRFESPKSTDPAVEIKHWREMALREHAARQSSRKEAALQAEQGATQKADEMREAVQSALAAQAETAQVERAKLLQQQEETNRETQSVVHRMVGMAKELSMFHKERETLEQVTKPIKSVRWLCALLPSCVDCTLTIALCLHDWLMLECACTDNKIARSPTQRASAEAPDSNAGTPRFDRFRTQRNGA